SNFFGALLGSTLKVALTVLSLIFLVTLFPLKVSWISFTVSSGTLLPLTSTETGTHVPSNFFNSLLAPFLPSSAASSKTTTGSARTYFFMEDLLCGKGNRQEILGREIVPLPQQHIICFLPSCTRSGKQEPLSCHPRSRIPWGVCRRPGCSRLSACRLQICRCQRPSTLCRSPWQRSRTISDFYSGQS